MKKTLLIVACLFVVNLFYVQAEEIHSQKIQIEVLSDSIVVSQKQDVPKAEVKKLTRAERKFAKKAAKKAAKLAAQEKKRIAKEKAKEEKEFKKMLKRQKKEKAKLIKLEKTRIKYKKFLTTYSPIRGCTGLPDLDNFFKETNMIFALVHDTETRIDFIQIETREVEEDGLKITEMYARNKNTGQEILKHDALKAYSEATVKLGLAVFSAYKLIKSSTALYKIFSKDPSLLLKYMMKIKKSFSALYMTVKVVPLIQRKIKENSEGLKQLKNN